jgi:hypothetical protein
MTKDDTTPKPVLPALFQSAGGFRDALLVGIGLFYALGLLTWSYSALERHMGFMDALDAQYLIAGIVPRIPVLVLAFLFYTSLAFQYRVREAIRNLVISVCLVMAILQVAYALFAIAYHVFTDKQITLFDVDGEEVAVSIIKNALYFSDKTLLFKLLGHDKAGTFEIARSAVSVVTWCQVINDENRESECHCNIQ